MVLNCCSKCRKVPGRESAFLKKSKLKVYFDQSTYTRGSIACTPRRLCTCCIAVQQGATLLKQTELMYPSRRERGMYHCFAKVCLYSDGQKQH